MENATQALYMAAGVLIAVMIISIGVFLFTSASFVGDNYERTMSDTEIEKFNSQFSGYEKESFYVSPSLYKNDSPYINRGMTDDYIANFNSVSDVVSAINKAYTVNAKYKYDIQVGIQVTVNFGGSVNGYSGVYGIHPLYQKKYYEERINNKGIEYNDAHCFYSLIVGEKSKNIPPNHIPKLNKANNLNTLLEKFSESKFVEGIDNDVRVYRYVFDGITYLNEETGLIDRIEFTCKSNTKW